jgi:hypothetical protein
MSGWTASRGTNVATVLAACLCLAVGGHRIYTWLHRSFPVRKKVQLNVSCSSPSSLGPASSAQPHVPLTMTDLIKHEITAVHTEVKNIQMPPSDFQRVEQTSGSIQLYSSTGQVRLIPVPTDDPRDPLTWPRWKRYLILATLAAYGTAGFGSVQSTPLYFSLLIPQYLQQTRGVGLPHFLII